MPEPVLQYDDPTHTYKVNGVVYPSVTQVLREAGLIDATWYTEEGAERGKAVALITELWDKGELADGKLEELYPRYVGYLVAWGKFLEERVKAILGIEERVYNHLYHYAGTQDRRLRLIGDTCQTIVDIKTGAVAAWEPLQTAGYLGCSESVGGATKRMAVHLRRNGKYTCCPHENFSRDFDVFRSALCLANWKREHMKTGDRYA